MTNEELISKYYDGNMQALYDLYEQNVGFIHSVAAAVAKDYKNYLRFSDTFEDLVQVGCLTFFKKLKAKKYDASKGSLLTYLTPRLRYAMQEFIENFSSPAGLSHSDFSKIQRCRKLHNEGMSNSDIAKEQRTELSTLKILSLSLTIRIPIKRFTLKLALSFSRSCLKAYRREKEKFLAENMAHSGMKRPLLTTLRIIC